MAKKLIEPDGIYNAITDEATLKGAVDVIYNNNIKDIGIDTETTSLDYLNCGILGISLAYVTNDMRFGWYIPVRYVAEQLSLLDDPSQYLDIETINHYLNKPLADKNITKHLHNAKFDLHVLNRHGFDVIEPIYDTMIGAWVLGNVATARYGLKHLAEEKLGIKMIGFSDITGKNNTFSKVSLNKAVEYAGPDGDVTLRLAEMEIPIFNKYRSLKPTLDIELKCIPILKGMEKIGALVDKDYLRKQSRYLSKQMKSLNKQMIDILGDINIDSDQQLKAAIKKRYDIRLNDVQASTLENIFEYNEDVFEEIKPLLDYRKCAKLKSVYCDGILDLVENDGRVHTSFYQMLKTGRLSSKKPNLQNIPAYVQNGFMTKLPPIRHAFITKPGYKFVSIDYSQLELRVITHVSNEQYWIKAFNDGKDIHSSTAAAVFGKDIDSVTKFERKRAKFVNFGLLYGESAYGLSKRENMTVEEAEGFIARYFSVLPKIQEYVESRKRQVITQRYTETFNGRRLYFKYDKKDRRAVAAAQREGINFPIQGGASDIVKSAMYPVHELLKNYKTNMILQVHDELDFEMAEDEIPILIPKIVDIMSNVFDLKVDLLVDVEIGDNWGELKEYKL